MSEHARMYGSLAAATALGLVCSFMLQNSNSDPAVSKPDENRVVFPAPLPVPGTAISLQEAIVEYGGKADGVSTIDTSGHVAQYVHGQAIFDFKDDNPHTRDGEIRFVCFGSTMLSTFTTTQTVTPKTGITEKFVNYAPCYDHKITKSDDLIRLNPSFLDYINNADTSFVVKKVQ